MLIDFRFENYKCFAGPQTLSLVASNLKDQGGTIDSSSGLRLLPWIGLYGANAAGKSATLDAMHEMRNMVSESQVSWKPNGRIPRSPFILGDDQTEPTLFEVNLEVGGVRYTYGFSFDEKRFLTEYLSAYPEGRERVLFARDATEEGSFQFGRHLRGENRAISKLTRPNSLFLSAAAQNAHEELTPLFNWFTQDTQFLSSSNQDERIAYTAFQLGEEEEVWQDRISDFVRTADLGVDGIRVDTRRIPDEVWSQAVAEVPEDELVQIPREIPYLELLHKSVTSAEPVPMPLGWESRGTRAWLAMAYPVLWTLRFGDLLVIDELSASLHTTLAAFLVGLFSSPKTNPNEAQLIFNTHDTNLLTCVEARRDQIWFAEKDGASESHLYPLTEFRPRKNENLERGYLQGRYGAVPFLDDARLFNIVDGSA